MKNAKMFVYLAIASFFFAIAVTNGEVISNILEMGIIGSISFTICIGFTFLALREFFQIKGVNKWFIKRADENDEI